MNKICFVLLFISFNVLCYAQKITINGYITDENNEPLIGATVLSLGTNSGNVTNQYGFYSLSVKKGLARLVYSFVGFEKLEINFEILKDTTINIRLKTQTLKEVTIKEQRSKTSEKISTVSLPIEHIKKIPSLAGEADIIKALALTPGIVSGTEGSAGLYVRGGTPDQNLILLDEAVVYNPNHFFGFVSVFNSDAVKNVDLIKGGFPARYGGRLSSVVDVSMKEGSTRKNKTDIGIGLVASRVTVERPIIKDKMGFILSARSSYLNLILLPTWFNYKNSKSQSSYINYYMYDINSKINYKIDDNNQLFLSFYTGKDNFKSYNKTYNFVEDKSKLNWGNSTVTLRYNKIVTPKLFWKNMLVYSRFGYRINLFEQRIDNSNLRYDYKNFSGLNDYTLKSAVDYIPNNNHYIKFGLEGTFHQFTPQLKNYVTNDTSIQDFYKKETYKAFESSLFVEDEWHVFKNFKTNIGLRLNHYRLKTKQYYSFEPRLSLSYKVYDEWALKGAYSEMQQNVHLLTNNGVGLQNDIWVPSTDFIKPQRSKQWAAGISKYFPDLDLEMSFEGYYKTMFHLIDFKEGANIVTNLEEWFKAVENNGTGWSRGLEFFLHKKTGRLNGFISYTLSKTERQFNNINLGEKYPFRYDSRHNFSITGNYQLTKKWDFSFTWVYKSGEPITLPVAIINVPFDSLYLTNTLPIYTKRNGFRLPSYHRADIAFNKTIETKKGRKRTWSFSIYNLYNRRNILYVEIVNKREIDNTGQHISTKYIQELKAKSLLPIVPSIIYAVSF
jgi:outer membrane receptor for ferrienterochelin and colicin